MKVLDPGHCYKLDTFDGDEDQMLIFMHRVGSNYPGNQGEPYCGTNCQEVIRALIDRVKYLDKQISHPQNANILNNLRLALLAFEVRAAERHNRKLVIYHTLEIEHEPSCKQCGHISCEH